MPYSIFYFDEVELDIKEARSWYKLKDATVENRFLLAIENTIIKLQDFQKAYSVRSKNIRIAHTPIFPFSIHFYIDDINERIVIIAIIHGRRSQSIAKKRL